MFRLVLGIYYFSLATSTVLASGAIDTPGRILQSYENTVGNLSEASFWTMFRLAAALILATIACARNHAALRDKVEQGAMIALQWVFALGITFLVLSAPLPSLALSSAERAFLFSVSLASVAILPWRISKLLLPTAGHQQVLASGLYLLIAILLVLNAFNS